MGIIIPVIIVTVIGLIVGLGLSLAAKFMAVPVDEKQEKIRECLPGANCGACGFSGCDGYAAALSEGKAEPDKCAPGGATVAAALSEILGVEVSARPKIAFIACGGGSEKSKLAYDYSGMQSCAAAALVNGGPLECAYGCIGYGDCAAACPFGAIDMSSAHPVVCRDICVGCGKCTTVCPKGLISLVDKDTQVFVACSSRASGAKAAKECKAACVACRLCEKSCPSGAITIKDNLAVIDTALCTSCGKCREVCRRGVIA